LSRQIAYWSLGRGADAVANAYENGDGHQAGDGYMVEMSVAGIALDASTRSPIVLLRDPSGRRQVPIWIDHAQAQNIQAGLSPQQPPRPLSHDLMAAMLKAAGLHLERVIIHTIEDATFRASLKLRSETSSEPIELDARPSDAIALAVRTGTSIWMLEEVVADASIPVNAVADAVDQADFRRFLENVSPAEMVRQIGRARPDTDLDKPPQSLGNSAESQPSQTKPLIQPAPEQQLLGPAPEPAPGEQPPAGEPAPPTSTEASAADASSTDPAATSQSPVSPGAADQHEVDQAAAALDPGAQGATGPEAPDQPPSPAKRPAAEQKPSQPRPEPPAEQPPGAAP
jgi:bifunctional DNase/RNase